MENDLMDSLNNMYNISEKYIYVINIFNSIKSDNATPKIHDLDQDILDGLTEIGYDISSNIEFNDMYKSIVSDFLDTIPIKISSIRALPLQKDDLVNEWVEKSKNQLMKDLILISEMGIQIEFDLPDELS